MLLEKRSFKNHIGPHCCIAVEFSKRLKDVASDIISTWSDMKLKPEKLPYIVNCFALSATIFLFEF